MQPCKKHILTGNMMSKKILLTYKRRRFASASCANGSKENSLSSKFRTDASPGGVIVKLEDPGMLTKLNEDNVFCFRCGTFDINEDLLGCDSCCGSYHFRCIDGPLEEKWQCPVCAKEHNIEETMGRDVQENRRKHATFEGSDKEVAKCKDEDLSGMVALDIANFSGQNSDSAMMFHPSSVPASENKNIGAKRISLAQLTDLNTVEKPPHLEHSNLSAERHVTGCSDDSTPSTQNLDKSTNYPSDVGNVKEHHRVAKGGLRTPLITFSRRMKKKACASELVLENNSKSVAGSLNQIALSSLHGTSKDKVADGPKNGLEAPLAEIFVGKMIPSFLNKDSYSHDSKELDLSQPGEPSDITWAAAEATFRPGDSMLMHGGARGAALDLTISQPAFTFSSNSEHIKLPKGVVHETLPKPENSSTPNGNVVAWDEETDEPGKSLGWFGLDNALSKGWNSLQPLPTVSNGATPFVSPMYSLTHSPMLNQDFSREYINEMGKSHRRLFLTPPGILEKGLHQEDPRSVHVYDRRLSWLALNSEPPLPRQDLLAENMVSHHRLKETQGGFLENFRSNPKEWSEEELDFLWIGVRRYGMCRWNAVLRDPKLRFLASRSAVELAARWELEQRKLLNGTFVHPELLGSGRSSSSPLLNDVFARLTSGAHYGSRYGSRLQTNPGFHTLPGEVVVSPGDVYLERENLCKRTPSNPPSGSYTLEAEFQNHRPAKLPILRRSWEQTPSLPKRDVQPTSGSSLPHWLKEVIPCGISGRKPGDNGEQSCAPLPSPNPDEPPSAPPKSARRRGLLKRRSSAAKSRAAGPSSLSNILSMKEETQEVQLGNGDTDVKQKKSFGPAAPNDDLVVIDSDASSEETISDNETAAV